MLKSFGNRPAYLYNEGMMARLHILLSPILTVLLAFVVWGYALTPAYAQEPALTVNDVAEDLYCPLCSGLTVDVCELDVCADMKEVIAAQIAAGESEADIQAYFVEQYGQKVVGRPSTEGFHITAWILPFIGMGLAAVGLAWWLRTRSAQQPAPIAITKTPATSEYAARLERDLRQLEE